MDFIRQLIDRFRLDDENLDYRQFTVAQDGEEIVGFGRIKPYRQVFELCCLGVVEHRRNERIGEMLVRHLIEIFPQKEVYITTDLTSYFRRLGFEVVDDGPPELKDKLSRVCKTKHRPGAIIMVYKK